MDESSERWLPVVGYEGAYEVSDQGNMRSVERRVRTGYGYRVVPAKALTPSTGRKDGRRAVNLSQNNRQKTFLVAPLVLGAFVGPRPKGQLACHEDGNHLDDRLSNLRWDTYSGNNHDRVRHGNHEKTHRETCPRDHPLRAPNLVANHSGRTCLACARARSNQQHEEAAGRPFDFRAAADEHYAKIMAAA